MYRYVLLEKCRKTVQVGTYRYVPVQENVKKYVRVRTQLRTERYRAVQKGTGQYTKWYKAVQVKVQQGTRQYMAVHVSTRSAFALGRGRGGRGGGRFWCAFEIAALTAPTVASASSHCMHKLVYSSLGALARASPASATAPPFATRGQRRRRRRLAMPRQAPRQPQPQPRVAASHPDPLPHRRPRPAGGRREGRRHVAAKRRLR
jgi:hypothetical protein